MDLDTIVHSDCLSYMKTMASQSVDVTICSPPYFQQRDYDCNSDAQIGVEESLDEYLGNLLNVFKECVRVTKDTGSVIFNLGDKYKNANLLLVPFKFAIKIENDKDTRVKLINNVTWVKTNPTPRQYDRRMVQATEPFFHFVKCDNSGKLLPYKYYYHRISTGGSKSKPRPNSRIGQKYFKLIKNSDLTEEQKSNAIRDLEKTIKKVQSGQLASLRMKIKGVHAPAFGGQQGGRNIQMDKNGYTIIDVPGRGMLADYHVCSVESIRGRKHSAIYPQVLIERFIELTTDDNDIVFDPFMGSGTTAKAAKTTGRHYFGIELCAEYIEQFLESERRNERSRKGPYRPSIC